jgi:hypothetical protein
VLRLVAHRLSISEIAAALVVGETTVRTPNNLLAPWQDRATGPELVVLGATAAQR